jgi:low molecular weight protein-tyrosine phosphatase
MTSVLVVCTGNVCRSPSAEGLLRRAFDRRLGDGVVEISSAGTAGWEGSPPTAESIRATAERGVDIADHRASILTADRIDGADLIVTMTSEHRAAVAALRPEADDRTFTIRELAAIVDGTTSADLDGLVAIARARRDDEPRDPWADDVADPLGMPLDTYRAMAADLDDLAGRIAGAIVAAAEVPS